MNNSLKLNRLVRTRNQVKATLDMLKLYPAELSIKDLTEMFEEDYKQIQFEIEDLIEANRGVM